VWLVAKNNNKNMKNKILYGIAVMVIAVIAAFNVTLSLQKNNDFSGLSLANVEALADGESECQNESGYWNMALVCADGGVHNVECTIKGELRIWDITIFSASYTKGSSYPIVWERWQCQASAGNCCIASKQGVKIP
jgi:hypothetical protein